VNRNRRRGCVKSQRVKWIASVFERHRASPLRGACSKGRCVSGSELPSSSTLPWWSKLMQPLWRDVGTAAFQSDVSLGLHQSLICGADLADQVAAVQTRSQWRLGVLRKRLWQFGIERATDLFHRRQVAISSLSWAGGFTGSLGFQFREAVDDALMAIEEADRIGAETLVIAPGGQGTFTYRHARRMAIDGVQRLVSAAADRHLRLAVLVDLGAKFSSRSLIQNWDAAAEFLADLDAPHVGLAAPLPSLNYSISGPQPWEACASKLYVVTSPAEPGTQPTRQPSLSTAATAMSEAGEVLSRLHTAGFRGTWEFASTTGSAPWWNGREALLHCCSWVNMVARHTRRVRAG
jgi:hypothetical protein